MADDVAIREYVDSRAELHDDARAGFFDAQQALKLGQWFGFDVNDRRRD